MTELEYIRVTNLSCVKHAIAAMRDTTPEMGNGENYGEFQDTINILRVMEADLHSKIGPLVIEDEDNPGATP